ncbi:MAG: glutamate--tRNA ligase [Patescibacteria group bacterium]|nr:glutamate--tRNA ligase [Patescibacteria group bacterium]
MKTMNKKTNVRVRFAPSPTGFLHIGGLRTALFNWLFARKNDGDFILRIEDTDQNRYVKGSVDNIVEALKWAGLDYDEGPDKAGGFGPYVQSERLKIYQNHADELIKKDKAYYCFCTAERLAELKEQQAAQKIAPRYDRHCRDLSEDDIAKRLAAKEPHVIRLKMPDDGIVIINDLIRGQVEFSYRYIDDSVIIKSDGFPTYQLANVVDDHLMKISHVIRAEEWLPSTPKHVFLYQSFGWDLPEFAHLPLIMSPQGGKLSKRDGAVSSLEYRDLGYLAEALINFIALLGWNPKTEQEVFSLNELVNEFSLDKVNKSGAIFNVEKLNYLNGKYIRSLSLDKLSDLCLAYFQKASWKNTDKEYLKKVVSLVQDRMVTLADSVSLTQFIAKPIDYDTKILIPKKSKEPETLKNLKTCRDVALGVGEPEFTSESLKGKFLKIIKDKKLKTGNLLWPFRVALSGATASPDVFDIAGVLGKSESLKRIDIAINKLENI